MANVTREVHGNATKIMKQFEHRTVIELIWEFYKVNTTLPENHHFL